MILDSGFGFGLPLFLSVGVLCPHDGLGVLIGVIEFGFGFCGFGLDTSSAFAVCLGWVWLLWILCLRCLGAFGWVWLAGVCL